MLSRLFPRTLSNEYAGSWAAVWLLAPVLVVKTLMAFNFAGFNPFVDVREVLRTVDGVPLDTFSAEAAAAVMDSAAAWGATLLALCLLVWIVLLRYRAALPLAILALLVEQVGRTGAGLVARMPDMISGGASGGAYINLALTLLLVLAFVFALLPVRALNSGASPA